MDIERINRWNRFIEDICGEDDGWEKTDKEYYDLTPSLDDCLQEFVEKNKNDIF